MNYSPREALGLFLPQGYPRTLSHCVPFPQGLGCQFKNDQGFYSLPLPRSRGMPIAGADQGPTSSKAIILQSAFTNLVLVPTQCYHFYYEQIPWWSSWHRYQAIPFLKEIRMLMDWMFTDTTLSLAHWLEIEDVYSSVYPIKCWRNAEVVRPYPKRRLRLQLLLDRLVCQCWRIGRRMRSTCSRSCSRISRWTLSACVLWKKTLHWRKFIRKFPGKLG